jgi:Flp pilus assembly protein TadG
VPAGARRGERGSAVVDFVLVLVVLIPLFLGILQLALVLHVRNTLASAAAEGARFAAVSGSTPAAGEAKAREQIAGAISARFAGRVSVTPAAVGGAPGYLATIEADVPALGIGGPAVHLEVSGNAVAEDP